MLRVNWKYDVYNWNNSTVLIVRSSERSMEQSPCSFFRDILYGRSCFVAMTMAVVPVVVVAVSVVVVPVTMLMAVWYLESLTIS